MKHIVVVGHDNYGSREIFSTLYSELRHHEVRFSIIITTGLYYKKSFFSSFWKLLTESSFFFCALSFFQMLTYKIKNDTLEKRARNWKIPLFKTSDINNMETQNFLKLQQVDLLVSTFTMHIFNQQTIDIPKLGTIGTHPSILPDYRGLEVFFWMLANQEKEGGVSVFFLTTKVDAGMVFIQKTYKIEDSESVQSIYKKLTIYTAQSVKEAILKIVNKQPIHFIKPHGKSRYFPMPTAQAFSKFLTTKHKWFEKAK